MSSDPFPRAERRRRAARDRAQWGTSTVLFLALFLGIYLAPGRPGGNDATTREQPTVPHATTERSGQPFAGL